MAMSGVGNGSAATPVQGGSTKGPGTNAVRSGTLRAAPDARSASLSTPIGSVARPQAGHVTGDGMKSGDKVAGSPGGNTSTGKSGGLVGSQPQGGGTSLLQQGLVASPQRTSGDINSRDGVPAYGPLSTPFGM